MSTENTSQQYKFFHNLIGKLQLIINSTTEKTSFFLYVSLSKQMPYKELSDEPSACKPISVSWNIPGI
jgi:hypothetical protein